MKRALLALVGLLACQAPPPLPPIEVYGERLLTPTARWLDAERLPVLRVAGELPLDTSFVLALPDGTHPLVLTRQAQRDGALLIWLSLDTSPAPGNGALHLKVGSTVRQAWPVVWNAPPSRWPELLPIAHEGEAGRPAEALAKLEGVLPTFVNEIKHFALVERARLLQRLGRSPEAITAWETAATSALTLPSPGEAARCLRAAAFSALVANDPVEAERRLDQAERLSTHPWEVARRDLQRGQLALYLGELARAADHLHSAISRAHATGADADHAAAVMALGTLNVRRGEHVAAQTLLEQARPHFEAPARPAEQAAWRINLAYALMTDPAGDQARAHTLLEEARDLHARLGNREWVAFCEVKLANIAHRRGEIEAARTHAAAARREAPDGVDLQEGPLMLLEIELATTASEARRLAEHALEQSALLIDREVRWQAWHALGRLERRLGRPAEAGAALAQALEILEDLGRRTSVAEGRATYFADREAPVRDAIALLLEAGEVAEAFAVADAARSRVARSLEGQARVSRLPPEARRRYAEKLGAWMARRGVYERDAERGRRLPSDAQSTWLVERAQMQAALAAEFADLQRLLDAEVPLATPQGSSATALQTALEADAALLLFTPLDGGWTAFYVDQNHLESRRVDPSAPLAAWADRLADRRRLYVVPGGLDTARQLHRATPLPVGYLPSAGLLRPAAPVAGEVLIIADPTSDLPHARAEGRALAQSLPGSHLLVGEAAHLEAVRTALPRARVIHFAGHGALDPTSPWEAHLSLAGGGRLTLRDVLALPLKAERVVLSGCETAGTRSLGPEHLGLAEAFVLAGARTVVAADEKIDDAATATWMARWYAAPGSPGEALVAVGGRGFRLIGRP